MQHKPRLTARQFRLLVALWTTGSTILGTQSFLVSTAKQDAWIAVVLSAGMTMLFIWMYTTIGSYYPESNFIEVNRKLLGKWVGNILALNWIITAYLGASGLLAYVGYFMAGSFMKDTPIQAFHLLFLLLIVAGLYYGIETLGRAAEILFVLFIFSFAALVLLVLPQAEAVHILPVFESGMKPLAHASFVYLSYPGFTLVFFLMMFPTLLKEGSRGVRAFYEGAGIGHTLVLLITIVTIMVLGVEETARAVYPSYELARRINIGNFITRIEVIMAMVWFIGIFFELSIYLFASIAGTAQLLGIKEYRVLILPIAVILMTLSIIVYPNNTYESWWDTEIWPVYMMVSGIVHPLLLLAAAALRKKRRNESIMKG